MASVTLRPDVSLWADPAGTRVPVPYVKAQPIRTNTEITLVRFEGRAAPTPFRGEGRATSVAVTCVWPDEDHADVAALLALLSTAHAAPDGRLLLRTNSGTAAGLDRALACVVGSWTDEPQMSPPLRTVSFTARQVHATVAV